MKIAGFTFIRNAIKNDYSIVEAITSILPICDEFVVAFGQSEDNTLGLIQGIKSDKIRIIETIWDDTKREGGRVFALETDKAYQAISPDTDWAFYIQGDECVHEDDLNDILEDLKEHQENPEVEGLLFKYRHFYGSFDYIASSRRWYRKEIRLVRFNPLVHSYKDAQGFRKAGKKLKVKEISAHIFHYGWVKPPIGLNQKVRNFTQFYHDDAWLAKNVPADYEFDFGNAERLIRFAGTHPNVSQSRIQAQNWEFDFDPAVLRSKMSLRRKVLQKIADWTGWHIGEYKNYHLI